MTVIGIDLGTTTTVVARRAAVGANLLKDLKGQEVIPSVIAYTPAGRIEIGDSAKARRLIDPDNTLYSVKRIIGRSWLSLEVSEYRRQYPFEMERGADNIPRFVTRRGNFTAAEASSHLLAALCETMDGLNPSGSSICITVPTSFGEQQRAAVLLAAATAGFEETTLIDEPHAAAIPYRDQLEAGQIVVVYDLGGGTFDMSVLRFNGDGFDVLGTGGDPYLGGDDIDRRCTEWACDRILELHRWDVRTNARSLQCLLFACERAKMRLSDTDETLVPLAQVDQVLEGKDLRLERVQLQKLFLDLMQRTFMICDEALAKARLAPKEADAVILAGGGSYIPTIRHGVEHYFGLEPWMDVPPDRVVALGAARAKQS